MIRELIKNKKYMIEAYIGYSSTGKRIRKYETFYGTCKAARFRELEIININKYSVHRNKNLTFKELSTMWIEKHALPKLSKKTVDNYNRLLIKINNHIGHYKIEKIMPLLLEDFYNNLRLQTHPKPLTENTILHYYILISAIFNKAIKWQLIERNPNSYIDRPKIVKKLAKFYDIEQTKQLLKCLDNEYLKYQALIRLAIDSGARAGELLGLEWKDINFDKKTINIDKTLILTSNGIEEKNKPKNNSSIRIIRITDNTVEILKAYKDEQELIITKLKSKWNGCKKVFTSNSGGYMYLTTPVKIIKSIAKKYNLPSNINFHSLRHTSASIQIALGIHTKVISKRLGHSSITITDNIYSHISSSLEDEVVNKLNTVFKKNSYFL